VTKVYGSIRKGENRKPDLDDKVEKIANDLENMDLTPFSALQEKVKRMAVLLIQLI